MSWSLIAHTGVGGVAGGVTTGELVTTGADLIVLACTNYVGSGTVTVADSEDNTWDDTLGTSTVIGYFHLKLYFCASPAVSGTHTFSCTGTNTYSSIGVYAFSGAHATPKDVENGAVCDDQETLSTGSVTPSQANSLIVTALGWRSEQDASSPSINQSFTHTADDVTSEDFVHEGLALAWKEHASGAVNPAWSWTNAIDAATRIAVFKPDEGGSPGSPTAEWVPRILLF